MNFALFLLEWIPIPFAIGMAIQFFRDGCIAYGALSLLVLLCLIISFYKEDFKAMLSLTRRRSRPATTKTSFRPSSRVRNPINWGTVLGNIDRMARPVLAAAGKFLSFIFGSYTKKPWMWSGVIVLVAAGYLFLKCYTFSDWHAFHVGLLALPVAGALFVTHAGGWSRLFTSISTKPAVTHAVISAIALFVCLGHALWWTALSLQMRPGLSGRDAISTSFIANESWWYGAGMSLLSLTAAIITLVDGWMPLGKWLLRVAGFVGGLFIGKPGGFIGAVIAWGMLLATTTIGTLNLRNVELTTILYTAFIFVVFGGVGAFTFLKMMRR